MFVHLVLIKLKPGVTRADPRVPAWEALFKALPPHCTGIVRLKTVEDPIPQINREIADWIICDYEAPDA